MESPPLTSKEAKGVFQFPPPEHYLEAPPPLIKQEDFSTNAQEPGNGCSLFNLLELIPPSHFFGHMPWAKCYVGHVTKDVG